MIPLLLPATLLFAWVIHHNVHKNKGNDKQAISSYLKREAAANNTRRQDISSLPYITVPLSTFPFDITLNDPKKQSQIAEYQKTLEDLANKKLLNLIGISNTELKERYGPANLELLITYDQNYTTYLRTLQDFADCLYDEYPEQAVDLLEYCIAIGTDLSSTYVLLGSHYKALGDQQAFENLYVQIPDSSSISGQMIKNKLNAL